MKSSTTALCLFFVVATIALISQGTLAATTEATKHKKDKKRQQTSVVEAPTDLSEAALPQRDANDVEGGHVLLDITPSEEHNGKLSRKQQNKENQSERKLRRKERKKEERKQAKREQKMNHNRDSDDILTKKQEKKQAKKIARKELRKLQKQQVAGTEIVSFDDIVQERHGAPPIPNPMPPVDGTVTESQNSAVQADNSAATSDNMIERHHKRSKHQKKILRQQRRNKVTTTCENSDDCAHGHCCVEKKGGKYCKPSKKNEGQKCADDCMCRSGLVCASEVISPGIERGFCRVSGTQLNTDGIIGAGEDAVETAIDRNQ